MKAFQNKIKIIKNLSIFGRYFKITLDDLRIANSSKAGQFVMLQVNDGCQPLLRRPFSIHNVYGSKIDLLYEVVGIGTEILSRKMSGEYLDVIGPLGNGFSIRDTRTSGRQARCAILVAGGMGVAPLLLLAKQIQNHKVIVLIGAKTGQYILCEKEFKKLGCEVEIATDDGSRGFKGYVSGLLNKILPALESRRLVIYSCGPKPMLKEISKISLSRGIPEQASLEAHMACGIGVCLGCVIDTRHGFKRVCKEGPVFDADEIIWQ